MQRPGLHVGQGRWRTPWRCRRRVSGGSTQRGVGACAGARPLPCDLGQRVQVGSPTLHGAGCPGCCVRGRGVTVVAESGVGHTIHFGSDALRPRKAHRTTPTRTELRTQTKPIPTRSTTSIRTKKHPHAAPCVTSRRCPRAFTLGHAHACELAPLPPCRWPQPARPQQPRTACPLQPT